MEQHSLSASGLLNRSPAEYSLVPSLFRMILHEKAGGSLGTRLTESTLDLKLVKLPKYPYSLMLMSVITCSSKTSADNTDGYMPATVHLTTSLHSSFPP